MLAERLLILREWSQGKYTLLASIDLGKRWTECIYLRLDRPWSFDCMLLKQRGLALVIPLSR